VDRSDKLFLALLLVAVAASVYLAMGRARIEAGNRTVEMIVDADEVRQVAAAAGVSPGDVLIALRKAGATALAVRELKVEELVALGKVMPIASPEGAGFIIADPETLLFLAAAIQAKLPRSQVLIGTSGVPTIVVRGMAMDQLAEVPVALRLEDLRLARHAGLRVVARLMNSPIATAQAIEAAAAEVEGAGARLVVFREDQVLGFQDLVKETAAVFRKHGLLYGYLDMAPQKGDEALASRLVSHLVRVHSISDADMQTMEPALAAPRYQRAVREREVRACYLRLVLRPQSEPIERNLRHVKGIVRAIESAGFRTGPPSPFTAPRGWPAGWARAIALIGVIAGLLLLLRRLIPITAIWAWLLFLVAGGVGAAAGALRHQWLAPVAGLAAACTFPTLAVVWALQRARARQPWARAQAAIWQALVGLLAASVTTFAGALLVVGIFAQLGHMEGTRPFTGVKVAYTFPLLVIFLAVVAELPGKAEPLARWWHRARLRLVQFFAQPVTLIEALVVLVALGALAFAVMRSGNQPAVAPSPLELKLRATVESALAVRPRTKEFLLGHPALMLAIGLSLRGRRTWLPLVAVLGGIGQVSLLNTFCHFHMPLRVGLLRTAHGMWLGALLGVIVVLIWRVVFRRRAQATGS